MQTTILDFKTNPDHDRSEVVANGFWRLGPQATVVRFFRAALAEYPEIHHWPASGCYHTMLCAPVSGLWFDITYYVGGPLFFEAWHYGLTPAALADICNRGAVFALLRARGMELVVQASPNGFSPLLRDAVDDTTIEQKRGRQKKAA